MTEIVTGLLLVAGLYLISKLLHDDLREEFFYNPMNERITVIKGVIIKERFCKPQYK